MNLVPLCHYAGELEVLFVELFRYGDAPFKPVCAFSVAERLEMMIIVLVIVAVYYKHLRAHETVLELVCRLLLEKKNNQSITITIHK